MKGLAWVCLLRLLSWFSYPLGSCHINIEAISKMPNGPISASGLNRNPRNITTYSCGYDPTPSLTSNHFSIFEIASNRGVLCG